MRKVLFFSLILVGIAGLAFAQTLFSLDRAISEGARDIEAKLGRGDRIVVLSFRSPSRQFSNHVLDELMAELHNGGKLIVVDWANLQLQDEVDFQMSGEAGGDSVQAIGEKLGAQSVVTGGIEDMGTLYRIRFQTISVESAAIQVLSTFNVQKDNQIAFLIGGSVTGSENQSTDRSQNSQNTDDWKWGSMVRFKPLATVISLALGIFELDFTSVSYVTPNLGIAFEYDMVVISDLMGSSFVASNILIGLEGVPARHKEKSGLYLTTMGGVVFGGGFFSFYGRSDIGYQLVTDGGFVLTPAIGLKYGGLTGISFDIMLDIGFAVRKRARTPSSGTDSRTSQRYNDRGLDYMRRGDYDRAIEDFNEAIQMDPNFAMAYRNRGYAYLNKGDYDRAIADYTASLRLESNSALAYRNRGRAYAGKGDYDSAVADFEASLRIEPNHTETRQNLENARQARGQ